MKMKMDMEMGMGMVMEMGGAVAASPEVQTPESRRPDSIG